MAVAARTAWLQLDGGSSGTAAATAVRRQKNGGSDGSISGSGSRAAAAAAAVLEQVSNKESAYKYARYCKTNVTQQYSKGKQVTFDLPLDMKERKSLDVHQPARIKMVRGHAWSPGIYRALRLRGKSLDVAWERAFIHPLTFNE